MKKLLFLFAFAAMMFTVNAQTAFDTISPKVSDPDGTVASIKWEKLSGPNMQFSTTTSVTTIVSGLTAGVYVFQMTATDNQGATSAAQFELTVLPKNRPPVITIDDPKWINNKKTIQIQ